MLSVRSILAYWLVGREIVQEFQCGKYRAEYGKRVLAELSHKLNKKFGAGFSVTSLKYFRSFYQVYSERLPEIGRPASDQSMRGDPEEKSVLTGFSPQLSWSHYRALMRVVNNEALSHPHTLRPEENHQQVFGPVSRWLSMFPQAYLPDDSGLS